MAEWQVKLKGLEGIDAKLKALPDKLARKLLKRALKAGGEILRAEVERNAPRAPTPTHPKYGHLKDQIGLSVRATAKDGITATIGTGSAYWARFLEYGSGKPRDPYDPNRPGRHAFMRPAVDSKREEVVQTVAHVLIEEFQDLVSPGAESALPVVPTPDSE